MKSFTTPKGTVLPLLELQGQPYLQPAYRLIWFREENPNHSILSTVSMFGDEYVKAEVTIKNENGAEVARANSVYKFAENASEGAETGAMGRALAWLGYGTQFMAERGDDKRPVVDSPIAPAVSGLFKGSTGMENAKPYKNNPFLNKAPKASAVSNMIPNGSTYVVEFGKHKNKTLAEITKPVAEAYALWLTEDATRDGKPLNQNAQKFIDEVNKAWPGSAVYPPKLDDDSIPF
jgi:hypothetical protein